MSRDGRRKRENDDNGWASRGGYMAAKVSKLEEQFKLDAPGEKQKGVSGSSIFAGVAIHVNGYTDPSADELRRLMMMHGGQFHLYYSRSKTTHIIATNLPNSKIQELRDQKVVRPEWITESVKAGHLLSYLQFQLYAKQKGLSFPSLCVPPGQETTAPGRVLRKHCRFCRLSNTCSPHYMCILVIGVVLSWQQQTLEGSKRHGFHPVILNSRLSWSNRNGSLLTYDNTGTMQMNGAREGGPCLIRPPKGAKNHPVTNGFALPVNGALKPLDLSPTWPHPPSSNLDAPKHLYSPPRGPSSPTISHHRNHFDHQSAKAKTGGIISEYYSHSRLHHISTWRNEFSEYVNTLQSSRRATGGANFPGRDRLRRHRREGECVCGPAVPGPQSCILHVDMDCFFVSVGIRHRPDLKGKPVAVTSNRGPGRVAQRPGVDRQLEMQYYQKKYSHLASDRKDEDLEEMTSPPETERHASHGNNRVDTATLSMAEIASCSYEARQAGVRNGMFFGQAKLLCPSLQSVPYDFQAYKEVALTLYNTLASYTHSIEALSCDEALVDGSALLAELGVTPDELASAIRADVKERTGCSASVGMGSNILLARMATRKAKPDGQYLLRPEEVDDFIRDQTVTSLPGVGRSMGGKLASLGVRSCGDLQQVTLQRLQKEFGPRTGQTLFRFCRGLDDRPVRSEKERKSVSAEMNYNIRFTQVDEAESFLTNLSMELEKRLQGAGLKGRRLTLKVMVRKAGAPLEPSKYGGHGICDNLARSVTLAQTTDSGQLIACEVIKLFHTMSLEVRDLRGVGLQVQLLEGAHSDPSGPKSRSIRDIVSREIYPPPDALDSTTNQERRSSARVPAGVSTTRPLSPAEPIPGTSKGEPPPTIHTPTRTRLNLSIEVPSPSQVDRSVLEALPAELREQVESSWTHRETMRPHYRSRLGPSSPHPSPPPPPRMASPPEGRSAGTLVLQIPNQSGQSGSTGIILELPDFSQVDPDVFAALPPELQEELRSAYVRRGTQEVTGKTAQTGTAVPSQNPLLQLKNVAAGVGRVKRRYKRKNTNTSPAKKGPSPLKRPRPPGSSPAKALPHALRPRDLSNGLKLCGRPTLAGAWDFTDIRTLLREWVTTISEPMEEDILQVVKYCTDLIEDKDLEKLDLVIKCMKRLMQQSVESVWCMAFDFILDNVQVVVQQTYGSTLKIT
uniref:DNA repair protein REV1 n=1 Tax=Esox lucius TaxID=8010 RepID=A0AAY5KS83_ESOLU